MAPAKISDALALFSSTSTTIGQSICLPSSSPNVWIFPFLSFVYTTVPAGSLPTVSAGSSLSTISVTAVSSPPGLARKSTIRPFIPWFVSPSSASSNWLAVFVWNSLTWIYPTPLSSSLLSTDGSSTFLRSTSTVNGSVSSPRLISSVTLVPSLPLILATSFVRSSDVASTPSTETISSSFLSPASSEGVPLYTFETVTCFVLGSCFNAAPIP